MMGRNGLHDGEGQLPACRGPRCCRKWYRWQCSSPSSAGSAQGLHKPWHESQHLCSVQCILWTSGGWLCITVSVHMTMQQACAKHIRIN